MQTKLRRAAFPPTLSLTVSPKYCNLIYQSWVMNVPRQCSAVSYFKQPRLQLQLRPVFSLAWRRQTRPSIKSGRTVGGSPGIERTKAESGLGSRHCNSICLCGHPVRPPVRLSVRLCVRLVYDLMEQYSKCLDRVVFQFYLLSPVKFNSFAKGCT